MGPFFRTMIDDIIGGGYITWVYLNPWDGRMWDPECACRDF